MNIIFSLLEVVVCLLKNIIYIGKHMKLSELNPELQSALDEINALAAEKSDLVSHVASLTAQLAEATSNAELPSDTVSLIESLRAKIAELNANAAG